MTTAIGFALAALAQTVERTDVPWASFGLSLAAGLLGAVVVAVALRRRPGLERVRRRFGRA